LVLLAAGQSEIKALDLKGEVGDIVLPKRRAEEDPKRVDQRDNQRRRRPKARSHGRVDGGGDCRRNGSSPVVVPHHALVDAAMQLQACLWEPRRRLEHFFSTQILSAKHNLAVVARSDERIGETVDRRV